MLACDPRPYLSLLMSGRCVCARWLRWETHGGRRCDLFVSVVFCQVSSSVQVQVMNFSTTKSILPQNVTPELALGRAPPRPALALWMLPPAVMGRAVARCCGPAPATALAGMRCVVPGPMCTRFCGCAGAGVPAGGCWFCGPPRWPCCCPPLPPSAVRAQGVFSAFSMFPSFFAFRFARR